jgi:hypothetical protein
MELAPGQEAAHRPRVGFARIRIADVGGEDFKEAAGGALAGISD